ncbi:MAG: hypothetical protein R3E91_04180 [Chlamydiales bacterium]
MKEDKLLHLLKKKKGFFETILDLTETETDLPFHDWIAVLEQKKILLSCVDELDAEIYPFQRNMAHLSQEISEELEEIRKVIRTILQLDSDNQTKRKQELKPDARRSH